MGRLLDALGRLVFQRSLRRRDCSHLESLRVVEPEARRCRACEEEGTNPVKLRMCLVCGTVGCCDSSPAKHARRHHEETGHPLLRSVEQGESWAWCYVDEAFLPHLLD